MRFCLNCKSWFDDARTHYCIGGPDEGHTFRFSVTSRMSSKVVGDEHHSDADWYGPAHTIFVRAWSLREAARKVAELPFSAWTPPSELTEEP